MLLFLPESFERNDGCDHEEKEEKRTPKKRVGYLTLDYREVVWDWLQGHEDCEAGHVITGTGHLTSTCFVD